MLKIEMLPAGHGDCLWIEYGDAAAPRRILIDGGARGTYQRAVRSRMLALAPQDRRFELLVVTHIDADHIQGTLDLLRDTEVDFRAQDIWFNGYRHLPDENPETLGPVQGEALTDLLVRPGVAWNHAFGQAAACVGADGVLPRIELEGELYLTLLGPTPAQLAKLKPEWDDVVRKAGLDPTAVRPDEAVSDEGFELLGTPDVQALAAEPFKEDDALANGSSIALLLEYRGRRVLLAGDAHPGVVTASIRKISGGAKLDVDACKLPHHGSKANVSRAFVQALNCRRWLFSSNGAHFRHPDPQAVARVVTWGGEQPELVFNYRTPFNDLWAAKSLRDKHGYRVAYPEGEHPGATIVFD